LKRENWAKRYQTPEYRAYQNDYNRRWRAEHPLEFSQKQMWRAAKRRAVKLGVSFSITLADIVIPRTCPVLPWIVLTPAYGSGKQSHASPSLDRLIPELGYVPGNVRVISWRANDLKRDATLEELEAVANFVRSISKLRRVV
jgi:hypothetical protein